MSPSTYFDRTYTRVLLYSSVTEGSLPGLVLDHTSHDGKMRSRTDLQLEPSYVFGAMRCAVLDALKRRAFVKASCSEIVLSQSEKRSM